MAKVEIDENDLAEYQRVYNTAVAIGKHEKARHLLQEAVALANPDAVGPEHRIRTELAEFKSEIGKQLSDFLEAQKKGADDKEAADSKARFESQWLAGRKIARDAGYTDEGLDKLEAFMEANGVGSHKVAIPAFERENPPPDPVTPTGGKAWNFFDRSAIDGDAALKALMAGDEDTFLNMTLPAALKEGRGG